MSLFRNLLFSISLMVTIHTFADVIEHPTCDLYLLTTNTISDYGVDVLSLFKTKNYNVFQIDQREFKRHAQYGDLSLEISLNRSIENGKRYRKGLRMKHEKFIQIALGMQLSVFEKNANTGETRFLSIGEMIQATQETSGDECMDAFRKGVDLLPECVATY